MVQAAQTNPNIDALVDLVKRENASDNMRQAWDQSTKPAAVLLDWDDHLIDSVNYYRVAGEHVIKEMTRLYGLPEPEKLYREKGRQKSSEFYFEVYGNMAQKAIDIHQAYLIDPPEPPTLKPGAKELLNFLDSNNIPYAIVSDTVQDRLENNAGRTLRDNGLSVPLLVGTTDDIVGKPEPDGIIKALVLLSMQTGQRLTPNNANVFLSGDRTDKDGEAARRAGISHVIIPAEKTGDTAGWKSFQNLDALTAALAETVGKKLQKPGYFERFSYREMGISYDETDVIAGEKDFIESPATDDPEDGITLTEEETEFHNLRWIAKRGKHLDGTGNYNQEEKLEAGRKVVDALLTEDMINRVADKSFRAVQRKRDNGHPSDEPIIVHLPHIGGSKNQLRIALLERLTIRLNEIAKSDYPDLNVEFRDAFLPNSPVCNVLSIAESLEGECSPEDIEPLSGHAVDASLTIKRSTGNLMERMAKQALFNFENFQEGDLVILGDDHVQTGSTFITQYQQLIASGIEVVALLALATMPESKNLQAHPDMLADLAQAESYAIANYIKDYPSADKDSVSNKFRQASADSVSTVGICKESLSNREALTLMACFIDGGDAEQLEWFRGIMDKYGCDPNVIERKGDSLLHQAEQPGMTPVAIKESIQRLIPAFTTKINVEQETLYAHEHE